MNCKTAQLQMALAVGEDLAPAETQDLQSHLQGCSRCQQTWDNHRRGFAVLQHSRTNESYAKSDSVWPALSKRLIEREAALQRGEFNGWIGALAVTAACVLIFVFSQDDLSWTGARPAPSYPLTGTMVISPSRQKADPPSLERDEVQSDGSYNGDSQPVSNRR